MLRSLAPRKVKKKAEDGSIRPSPDGFTKVGGILVQKGKTQQRYVKFRCWVLPRFAITVWMSRQTESVDLPRM